ncbi:(2Fe-2S)-binding protein [Streptomyces sp. NRRL F-5126]|uniref:(2Fe-2S)-binding protein n=1 Tax=Streptomyces sp. NRRL F-5126 TaxID=1463857 RepID=UPI00068A8D85|nr:(2Fe-2S)-binding protein [Streptomyces sp. NRRL F-5126]
MTDNETPGAGGRNSARPTGEWPEPDPGGQGDQGGWQPVPHGGEYDAEATAFVQLPPEDGADAPLAAPGHGYVPPMITPLQPDPSVAGTWGAPDPQAAQHGATVDEQGQTQAQADDRQAAQQPYGGDPYGQVPYAQGPYGQDPYAHAPYAQADAYGQGSYGYEPRDQDPYGQEQPHDGPGQGYPHASQPQDPRASQSHDPHSQDPHATAHWNFTEALGESGPAAPHDAPPEPPAAHEPPAHTGQWRIPLATGEVADDSGELSAALAASPWNAGVAPPATLPGGARAPWATDPEPAPGPESGPDPEPVQPHQAHQAPPAPHGPDAAQQFWAPTAAAAAQDRAGTDGAPEWAADEPTADGGEAEHAAAGAGEHGTAEHVTEEAPARLDGQDGQDGPAEPEEYPEEPPADEPTAGPPAPVADEPEPGARAPYEPAFAADDAPEPEPDPRTATGADADADTGAAAAADTAPEPLAGVSEPAVEPASEPAPMPEQLTIGTDTVEHPSCSYSLRVNGQERPVNDAWIGESLLYVLRERLGLAGAKDGCSQGECGACNVQVDGRLVASCLVPAATAAGSEVRTVEGLATDGEPSDVQRALAASGAVQCGFCVPGMAMTVHDLLEGNHAPSELETRQALSGNLCRCSGYRGVLEAVSEVVAGRAALAEAAAAPSDAPEGPTTDGRIPHQAPPGAGGFHGAHDPRTNEGGMA